MLFLMGTVWRLALVGGFHQKIICESFCLLQIVYDILELFIGTFQLLPFEHIPQLRAKQRALLKVEVSVGKSVFELKT